MPSPFLPPADLPPSDLLSVGTFWLQHPARSPEPYWLLALQLNPNDSHLHKALGTWHLQRGVFGKALSHLTAATTQNPDPQTLYLLALTLRFLNRLDEAYQAFQNAAASPSHHTPANIALAQIDALRGNIPLAIAQLAPLQNPTAQALLTALTTNPPTNPHVPQCLSASVPQPNQCLSALVPPPPHSSFIIHNSSFPPPPTLTHEFAHAGLYKEALQILTNTSEVSPLLDYYRAYFLAKLDQPAAAQQSLLTAAAAPPQEFTPTRLEEIAILLFACTQNPADARAPFYLGNLLAAKRRPDDALTWWEKAAQLDREFPAVWRNLGMAYYNVFHDKLAAKGSYQRAFKNSLTWNINKITDINNYPSSTPNTPAPATPTAGTPSEITKFAAKAQNALSALSAQDALSALRQQAASEIAAVGNAQIFYERDQIWKLTQETPLKRLEELENFPHLITQRDDLTIEYCTLLNLLQRYPESKAILQTRNFSPPPNPLPSNTPPERESPDSPSGTHPDPDSHLASLALEQWVRACIGKGRLMLWQAPRKPQEALSSFEEALTPPANFGHPSPPISNPSELHYWAALAAEACANHSYHQHLTIAAAPTTTLTLDSYWSAMALHQLGRHSQARTLLENMLTFAYNLKKTPINTDFLASSPSTTPLLAPLFDQDLSALQLQQATLLEALARHGLNGNHGTDRPTARRLLQDLLRDHPSHPQAADLLLALDWSP